MSDLTREGIITAARKAADENAATTLSRVDFQRLTGISQYHIYRLFPDGGWNEVVRLAGLDQHPNYNASVTDEALLAAFHSVAVDLGRVPTWHQFSARAMFSADTIRKRFGGTRGTIDRYRAWLEQNDPTSPLLEELQGRSRPAVNRLVERHQGPPTPNAEIWPAQRGIHYGAPIDFRGLRHAPINEQGVVFLFGMVCHDLGLQVEAVQSGFPDCVAKRAIDHRGDRWQQVRIEFEYRSSNFVEHGHDPNGCDVIVCWLDDWPDCPLQVIELRTVIDRLDR